MSRGSMRSPHPAWRPTTRELAVAISAASRYARGVSMLARIPTSAGGSSLSSADAQRRTSSGDSGLGRFTMSSASHITAARSFSKCGVPRPFTRTMIVLPWSGASARRNFPSVPRASSFLDSSTASSRSNDRPSASLAIALAKSSGREPGTKSLLRIALLQPLHDGLGELLRVGLAAEIAGAHLVLQQHVVDGLLDTFRLVVVAHVVEHHRGREHERERIGDALAGDVGRGTVHRLEDRGVLADVARGRHSQATHEAGVEVREDVAEEVRRHDHVELVRVHHELHGAGVDDALVAIDPAHVLLRDVAARLEEEARERLQHIRLVHERHLLALVLHRVLESELADAPAARARVHARSERHRVRIVADRNVVLESHVEPLEVLAHEHEVDVLVTSARS